MTRGDVVWITGASTGIGRELALHYVRNGAQVFATARSAETLATLQKDADLLTLVPMPGDITDRDNLYQIAQAIEQRTGYIDKLIVNAGTCEYFDVSDPDWEMMARVMNVNYFGAINTVEAGLGLLRKSPARGHIAAVASLASVVPFSRAQAYGASKAAMQYFFESLRVDLVPDNIAVTVVQPGFVATPLTAKNDFPMPFMISAEKAAKIIANGLQKQPHLIRFPRRLAWLLSFMGHLPAVWHRIVTKQLRRTNLSRTPQDHTGAKTTQTNSPDVGDFHA